jgi:hypothetical protein
LKLKCDEQLSNVAFNSNVRRYTTELRFRLRQYLRFRHMQQEGVMILSPERKYLISILSPQLRTETMVGRCRLTASKPELKARLVSASLQSALETKI